MPIHVKRGTLSFVPLDLVCDVVKLLEHVEELNFEFIEDPQQVRLPNTCQLTATSMFIIISVY